MEPNTFSHKLYTIQFKLASFWDCQKKIFTDWIKKTRNKIWFIVSHASERIRGAQEFTGTDSRVQSKFSSVDWGFICPTGKTTPYLFGRVTSAFVHWQKYAPSCPSLWFLWSYSKGLVTLKNPQGFEWQNWESLPGNHRAICWPIMLHQCRAD